jgi:serine/threonine protein kinase
MGEVYTAHDAALGRNVAIKLLPNEFTADEDRIGRFRQEARVVSALNHPNIITIYEIGESEFGAFLVTEFIEGETLRDLMQDEPLSLLRTLKIIEQAANALVAAHTANIIHRDIKPENIMFRQDGIVKVLDFGLAKPTAELNGGDNRDNKTIPGTVMGSARYMSPEQARGLKVDERTDIWSLGVVLYELVTGSDPFNGETTSDTIANVIYHEPEPLSEVVPDAPAELQRIVRKALQKDRDDRYQNAKDLAIDLRNLIYDLEHGHNAEKAVGRRTSVSGPSEAPTIIHKTASANHPTDENAVVTSGATAVSRSFIHRPSKSVAVVIGLLLIAVLGIGLFAWMSSGGSLASTAFERPQISRLNTDGKLLLPAISPDGKYVAYVSGEVGNRSLVVRQIATDSIVTVVPTTTLNFSSVTFSPDGNYIYYGQTRADLSMHTLYQVPTLGGTSRKLIEDIDSPVTFSPDGKHFAFLRHVPKTNQDLIFIADAATLELQQLIDSKQTDYDFFSERLAWAPDGRKILLGVGTRQGGEMGEAGEMAIAEINIADKSLRPLESGRFDVVKNFAWFADGSGFVFSGRETPASPIQIWRASYPELHFTQVTNDFNDYVDIGLSADGRTIVTLKMDASSSLWKLSPASKEMVPITTEGRSPEGTYGLAETRDGRVIFTRIDSKEVQIWTSDRDGKNARKLAPDAGSALAFNVTPDGRHIVFCLHKPSSSRIWRMDVDGRNQVPLTDDNPQTNDEMPQVTADGRTVIFQRHSKGKDRSVLMKVSIDGGPASTFYENETQAIFAPKISPDGKRIAFIAYELNNFVKKLMVGSINGDSFGGVEREMEYNLINNFDWSPDGRSLTVLTSRAGVPNLWRQPVDGSPAAPITEYTSGRIYNFAWINDGKNLLLARGSTNNDLILIRDAARGEARSDLTRMGKNRAGRRGVL